MQEEINKYKAMNNSLIKKKHKKTSSEEQTFIFNQTNISSYYPVMLIKSNNWAHQTNLRSHMDSVRALTFHNAYLISAGEDCLMKIWEKDQLKLTIREHLGPVYCAYSDS
eukprot:GHVR01030426.1.p1 GENE.GHVR01030426.1~~GHVR01030426.1.p1  ORF type:complete len:110 (-),score=0.19 GHVR01030426.1:133-462(-)